MLLTVTFHYIRNTENSIYPGIHGVSPSRLDTQLEYLCKNFNVIKPTELKGISKSDSKEKYCLITFDDGLMEQYEVALPILEKHNLKGLFFVNGINLHTSSVSEVHKVHYIRSITSPTEFSNRLAEEIDRSRIEIPLARDEFKPPEGQNAYDSVDVQYTKYLLFHVLSGKDRSLVVDKLYAGQGIDENEHSKRLYMGSKELIELSEDSCLGSHGWEHDVKNRDNLEETLEDFEKNQLYLSELTGEKVECISYPYGGKSAVSPGVALMAKKVGHSFGFTIERALTTDFCRPHLLPRLDANDIPHGKGPLFEIRNGKVEAGSSLKIGSDWYKEEYQ